MEDIWAKEQELIALEDRARCAVMAQRQAQDAQRVRPINPSQRVSHAPAYVPQIGSISFSWDILCHGILSPCPCSIVRDLSASN